MYSHPGAVVQEGALNENINDLMYCRITSDQNCICRMAWHVTCSVHVTHERGIIVLCSEPARQSDNINCITVHLMVSEHLFVEINISYLLLITLTYITCNEM